MKTEILKEDNNITAIVSGRLDTLSAPQFESDIRPLHEGASSDVTLDCKGLEYISSSGLRVFLALLKDVKAKGGSLTLRHVNDEIANIFKITGFAKLFTIK